MWLLLQLDASKRKGEIGLTDYIRDWKRGFWGGEISAAERARIDAIADPTARIRALREARSGAAWFAGQRQRIADEKANV